MSTVRINKHLSEYGYCSRREADRLIEQGRVFINGKHAQLGDRVGPGDQVRVEGGMKKEKVKHAYVLFYKPKGMGIYPDRRGKEDAISFINHPKRIFPIGRMENEVEGLLILTDDDEFANGLLSCRGGYEQEYVVEVAKPLAKGDVKQMAAGINLEEGKTPPAKVRQMAEKVFAIVLREERHHQIHRMVGALGNRVVSLKRSRIATLKLGTFPEGMSRNMAGKEIRDLKKLAGV